MRINTKRVFSVKVVLLVVVFGFLVFTPCSAQYTNLINFTGDTGSYIGYGPYYGSLIISGDTLYGTTVAGGISGYGNIFSVQTNGTNYKDLVDFTGDIGPNFGDEVYGSLAISGDTLYGMTWGGENIYSVQTNGTNFKNLVNFTGYSGSFIGNDPYGSLIISGDTLYGMTFDGGIHGWGNIFSVQTNGTNYRDLIDFTGPPPGTYTGMFPYGSLTISGDTLYGMTSAGGGNIFSVQTNGTNYKDLIDFDWTIGSFPHGSLILSGDTLYGMTLNGGITRNGNIFSVQTNGTNYKDLVEFTRDTGAYIGAEPEGSLTLVGNTLYGMTAGGRNGDGNIFSVQTNGTNYKDLIDFTGTSGSYNGDHPVGSLTLFGNTLYGTTPGGGVNGFGNIFRFTPLSATTSVNNNVTCNGGANGSASVTASEGTPPYTYSWSPNGGSNSIATGLSAGTYTVNVTDSTGLTSSAAVTITQPPLLSVSAIILANLHCNGVDSGSVYANVNGGTPPYTYYWVSIGNEYRTDSVTGLSAGTYTISVRDSNGCYTVDSAIITQPPAILVTTTIISPITNCTEENSGIIAASATGGILPYTYYWNDPSHQTTDTAIDLIVGNYIVTVTDNTGCSGWASNTLTAPNPFSDSATVISNVSCYGGHNGSATVSVSGGYTVTKNYSFEPAVQHFTVPPDIHTISINIGGAQGGDTLGGNGASFQGQCIVTSGEILSVAVGQKGGILEWAGGGGGASWVYDSTIVLYTPSGTTGLIAVAAGGGGQLTDGYPPYEDSIIFGNPGGTNLVTNATITTIASEYGAGGTGGNGGDIATIGTGGGGGGGAGGGWLSNGESRYYGSSFGGMDEANHFSVGIGVAAGYGGFGGGGGGGWSTDAEYTRGIGGGGGGYNGGSGDGGGGGSFFINTSPIVTANDTGNGFVTISYSYGAGVPPYTYSWSDGETTATATGLSAGVNIVTVEDSLGCSSTAAVTLTQPTEILVTTTIITTLNNCNGNMGVISASATGGIPPYTYQWSDANNQTTDTATGLSAGNYTITVTDNTGCTGWASNTFTLPNTSGDSVNVISNVSCYGGNNGSATIIVPMSGTVVRNYTYDSVVQHFTVPTGINTIFINIGGARGGGDSMRGGNGASFSSACPVIPGQILSIVVGQEGGFPEILGGYGGGGGGGASWIYDSSIVLYSPSGTTGLIAVAAGGGGEGEYLSLRPPVIYTGYNGGTNLVTNGTTNYSFTNNGGTGGNGGGEYNAGGGAGWLSNGASGWGNNGGMDEANHFAGTIGRGGNGGFGGGGGSGWGSNLLDEEYIGGGGGGYNGGGGGGGDGGGGGGSYFINTSPIVSANDTGNGFVTISYTVGGIPPYTYLWSNGETTAIATGLSAGTYNVTVSDSSGCLFTDSVTITQPNAIIPTITLYSGITCNGDSNAVVFANATGGSGFYEYQWSASSSQTDAIATGLSNGTYTVTVTDNNGCTGTASTTLTQPPPISVIADSINATGGNCNGSAWAIVSGGTNPYTYFWTGGLTTDSITNQCVNYYCCTITDSHGCVDSACITIDDFSGTNELKGNGEKVKVYPNPNNGQFTIELYGVSGQLSVEVYNVLGEQVYYALLPQTPKGALTEIDLSSQPSGVYLYRILNQDGSLREEGKVIILK